jgi:hypothetical protein
MRARLLLAAALLLSMIEVCLNVGDLGRVVPALAGWLDAPVFLVAVLVHVVGLVWWVRDPAAAPGAVLALAPIAAGAVIERLASPSGVHHGKLLPAAVLVAWIVALGRGGPDRVRRAIEAACGVTAATYTLAALAKIGGAGAGWFDPNYLGLLVLERAVGAPAPLAALRLAVAQRPAACLALATGALLIEGAGVLFVWPPARRPVALALVALHVGIAACMGYVYATWALVVLALAWADEPTRGFGRRLGQRPNHRPKPPWFVGLPHIGRDTRPPPPCRPMGGGRPHPGHPLVGGDQPRDWPKG